MTYIQFDRLHILIYIFIIIYISFRNKKYKINIEATNNNGAGNIFLYGKSKN